MTTHDTHTIHTFAPAKINLYLHVSEKLENGYHALDSLIAFANVGDEITLTPAAEFSLHIDGPFAESIPADENNLAMKAAKLFTDKTGKPLNCQMTLTKNLPASAGIGGGSADAAAALRALEQFWDIKLPKPDILAICNALGADVPVCYANRAARILGIGNVQDTRYALPTLHAVLINPLIPCPTGSIFKNFNEPFQTREPDIAEGDAFLPFIKAQKNQLTPAAIQAVPDIEHILSALRSQKNCLFARMSGSGASCFGIFESEEDSTNAARAIESQNPHWWVRACVLQDQN